MSENLSSSLHINKASHGYYGITVFLTLNEEYQVQFPSSYKRLLLKQKADLFFS